ncbi:hypothetical protein [Pseudoalteromonas galatheae]|nr:hypothetical protein [Pseudoalteromonas galatheae]
MSYLKNRAKSNKAAHAQVAIELVKAEKFADVCLAGVWPRK